VILFVVVSWLTTAPRARAEEFLAPVEAGLIKHRIR
jgi:hypothetical protein